MRILIQNNDLRFSNIKRISKLDLAKCGGTDAVSAPGNKIILFSGRRSSEDAIAHSDHTCHVVVPGMQLGDPDEWPVYWR